MQFRSDRHIFVRHEGIGFAIARALAREGARAVSERLGLMEFRRNETVEWVGGRPEVDFVIVAL